MSQENVELIRGRLSRTGWLPAFLSFMWDIFDDARVEVHELLDAGDQVLAAVTNHGRGKQSGIEASWSTWTVWSLRNGRRCGDRSSSVGLRLSNPRAVGLAMGTDEPWLALGVVQRLGLHGFALRVRRLPRPPLAQFSLAPPPGLA